MEKRRIRLEINGVVCGLITQESEEYMQSLADEVGKMMRGILDASPFITREAAALTAALSYCDDAKKNGKKAFDLQERVDELEVEAEIWQEDKAEMLKAGAEGNAQADAALLERLQKLEQENTALAETAGRVKDLEERAARLEDENTALREAAARASSGREEAEGLAQRVSHLEAENLSLRGEAEEQAALVKKAEQEKEGAIAAAKRAVEEAKKRVDQLEQEVLEAREEAKKAKEQAASPALDTLEREVREQEAEEKPQPPARPAGSRKRKNPLRYDEEFEQEGFVSFFEKK